jgi:hypothetical protein
MGRTISLGIAVLVVITASAALANLSKHVGAALHPLGGPNINALSISDPHAVFVRLPRQC